jgi:hypothetical protein
MQDAWIRYYKQRPYARFEWESSGLLTRFHLMGSEAPGPEFSAALSLSLQYPFLQ